MVTPSTPKRKRKSCLARNPNRIRLRKGNPELCVARTNVARLRLANESKLCRTRTSSTVNTRIQILRQIVTDVVKLVLLNTVVSLDVTLCSLVD